MPVLRTYLFLLLAFNGTAEADSWMMPTPRTYASDNGQYRLTVFPRELSSQLAYFESKVAGEEPSGQAPTGVKKSEATLERLVDNEYVAVWRKSLVNDVAPVSAFVSGRNGGFVTFDNWHSTGYGDDAIAIYDNRGSLVRKYALTDLISEEEFNSLPRSISSIRWSGDHHLFDNREFDFLRIHILLERGSGDSEPKSKIIYLRMSDGEAISKLESVYW